MPYLLSNLKRPHGMIYCRQQRLRKTATRPTNLELLHDDVTAEGVEGDV